MLPPNVWHSTRVIRASRGDRKDNIVVTAAIGLLAYVSADVSHHVFGHAGACLALGGSIISLSSVAVDCSRLGARFAIAGPLANLALGLVAVVAAHVAKRASAETRLLWILVAAFNLLWFALQLVFSVASRTDDWDWALRPLHVSDPLRYGLIAFGTLAYLATIRVTAVQLAPFARPRTRAMTIVLTAWLAAGAIACVTAAFDHNAGTTLFRRFLEQSLGLSIGLLCVPVRAAGLASPDGGAAILTFSLPWAVAATIVGAASILFLGPGVAIGG